MAEKKVLIVDDEPEYLEWLVDYFEAQGIEIDFATNLSEAFKFAGESKYMIVIIDMNIPAPGGTKTLLDTPISNKYPGYKVAHHFRNIGYVTRQVIAYTVHDDELLDVELRSIGCRYVLKGRPNILKTAIEDGLGGKK